jgi:hypothetical protein
LHPSEEALAAATRSITPFQILQPALQIAKIGCGCEILLFLLAPLTIPRSAQPFHCDGEQSDHWADQRLEAWSNMGTVNGLWNWHEVTPG